MGLPVAFLTGLLALFAAGEFGDTIPGSADPKVLAGSALLLLVPWLLALTARGMVRRRYVLGRLTPFDPERLLRLSALFSPVVVFLFASESGYGDVTWRLGGGHLLGALLAGVPLLLVEVPRLIVATQVRAWLQVEAMGASVLGDPLHLQGLAELAPMLRLRLGWVVIVSLPWLVLGVVMDLLALSRPAYALALGTSAAMVLGFLFLIVLIAVLLPLVIRPLLGVRPLPEVVRDEIARTATALGFDARRIYLLPTGMTAVNAMMIGPLPIARCLCLTDGLLHVLDGDALSGVVAHEVGHARRGHPGLLVLLAVVLPLMLLQPVRMLPIDELAPHWQAVIAVPIVLLLWGLVRPLAHRFELEADVASVQALGAGPCSRALLAVTRSTVAVKRGLLGRLSTLHPDDRTRLLTMTRYEREPEFRARFEATGRRLRATIVSAVAVALVAAAWTWSTEWKYERAVWHFWSGDIVAARAEFEAIGQDVPRRWQETWRLFGNELAAAVELASDATDWETTRDRLRARAGDRAAEKLRTDGAAVARSWFALAADAAKPGDANWLLLHQLYDFCKAVDLGDPARAEAVREVVRRRPAAPALLETMDARLEELIARVVSV